jgi:hypothetical protein
MDNLIAKLYKSPKTVLNIKDLALIWEETDYNNLKAKVAYYAKTGTLIRLTRGVFAKDRNYNPKELATSIYTPSYISFETVLREAGVIFQYYETIFVAGTWPKNIKIAESNLTFRKLKDSILFNPDGIKNDGGFSIATPERAFLDTLYLYPKYYFDNLSGLDWNRCCELVKIYNNKQLIKRFNNYYKQYAK